MPVTFKVAHHGSTRVNPSSHPLKNANELLAETWGKNGTKIRIKEFLQSSFVKPDFSKITPSHNGFVNTVIDAYCKHYRLVLRPDDVWIAILGQLNFYINAHAEELRSHFVEHEGKKELKITTVGTRYTVDFGNIAQQMTFLVDENVVDKDLKDWILPDFSTTTDSDTVTCAVMMMSTLKAYFNYSVDLVCGIPSVTLEGDRSDWAKILERIDKLDTFGEEPAAWANLLRPILRRFVGAFDGKPDTKFWGKVCHYSEMGSGTKILSGWITAFCVWTSRGRWQGPKLSADHWSPEPGGLKLRLDGVDYGYVDSDSVPPGFCEVDVKVNNNGEKLDCMMVSGHLARLTTGDLQDTVRPLPSWFMFVKANSEVPMSQ